MLKKIIKSCIRPLFNDYVYTIRHGVAKGLKRRGGMGFFPEILKLEEVKFLENLDLTDLTIFDIGGYEGVFTLFFTRAIGKNGRVITFEPNPKNYIKISENVKLNMFNNVDLWQVALGKSAGSEILAFQPFGFSSGSIQKDIQNKIFKERGYKTIKVKLDTMDNQIKINNLPEPNFVKIDVEGLELDVLIGMINTIKKAKPKLFIEIHGANEENKIINVKNVVEFLSLNNYAIFHVESKTENINIHNAEIAKEGHLYCT